MVLTGAAAQQCLWKCCNTLTMSQVKGITIGSLFQSSEASLTTPSKSSSQDAHTSPTTPTVQSLASSPENSLPGSEVWSSSFLPSTPSLLLSWIYILAILILDGQTDR